MVTVRRLDAHGVAGSHMGSGGVPMSPSIQIRRRANLKIDFGWKNRKSAWSVFGMPEDEIVLFTKGCHSSPRLTSPILVRNQDLPR